MNKKDRKLPKESKRKKKFEAEKVIKCLHKRLRINPFSIYSLENQQ